MKIWHYSFDNRKTWYKVTEDIISRALDTDSELTEKRVISPTVLENCVFQKIDLQPTNQD